MEILFRKITRVAVTIILVLIEVANLFLANIIVSEVTGRVSFDWMGLLKNRLFWGVLILAVVYHFIPFIIKRNDSDVNARVEEAIADSSIKLIKDATKSAREGNLESAEKLLSFFDKIRKRSGK